MGRGHAMKALWRSKNRTPRSRGERSQAEVSLKRRPDGPGGRKAAVWDVAALDM